MAAFREIVTKAVIGKGHKRNTTVHELVPEHAASKTLGCWIINHTFAPSVTEQNEIEVKGSYSIHVWYAFDNNCETGIMKRTIDYVEQLPFRTKPGETVDAKSDLRGFCTHYPTCIALRLLDGGHIEVRVDKEFVVDAVGETKLKVQITQGEEDWVLDQDIEQQVNPNYVKDATTPDITAS